MRFFKLFQFGNHSFSAYCLKFGRFCLKNYYVQSAQAGFTSRIVYKMKSAYFQYIEGSEKVHININFNEDNKCKAITFVRPIFENVETFLNRVELKLQSFVSNKSKKKTKKSNTIVDNKPEDVEEVKVCLLVNDKLISGELNFQHIFKNNVNGELKLRINNNDYDVFLNAPMVLKMSLPKKLYAQTVVFPDSMETQFMNDKESEFVWCKSKTPQKITKWNKCGEGFFYFIKEEDIGNHLKVICTPKMNGNEGPIFELVSASEVSEFNAFNEIKKRHEFTQEATKPNEFRIVSYNILADTYTQTKEAKTELFTFCDPTYLDFTYRKSLCISELLGYNADVICLQEVDKSHYSTLELLFSKIDFACLYHEKEGTREGCSFMYNTKKFNIFCVNQYTFSKELRNNPLLSDIKEKVIHNKKLIGRLNGISSQIQVVVLEGFSKNVLIIGNTHFYFHPDADHIRLLQGVLSFRILQNTYEETRKKLPDKKCSVLLCGDLNSTPECGFHQFLQTGSVGSDHIGWKSKEDEAITDLSCQHSFKMKSAYDNTQYTNYLPVFKGCLDFIYYQTDHLKLNQTVPIPSEEVLSSFSGIPSKYFPSDHIALVADLKFED